MTAWSSPPAAPPLPGAAIHLWRVELDRPPEDAERLAAGLAPDERARAERFHFARDRLRFIAGRAALRAILAGYLGVAPRDLAFEYGAYGKPGLRQPSSELAFNLSHARDLALVAVAQGRAIGVDVEALRELPDLARLAEHSCTAEERAALMALPAARRAAAFLSCWTCKEALLKARGEGLGQGLARVEVALRPDQPPRLLALDGDRQAAARWWLRSLAPAPGYIAALAAEGPATQMQMWQL